MAFGDTLRNSGSPGGSPYGIGGNESIIWVTENGSSDLYELSPSDFSSVRSSAAPGTNPWGVGGDGSTIWHSDVDTVEVYEVSTSDFSTIQSGFSPGTDPYGIGGDGSTIWHGDDATEKVYELSTWDFSTIQSTSSPGAGPYGIGGNGDVVWYSDFSAGENHELSTSDLSSVRSASAPGSYPVGSGGGSCTFWHSGAIDDLYELDAANVTAPETPQNLTSMVIDDTIYLDWDAVDWNCDEGHVDIKRTQGATEFTEIDTVAAGTTLYTDAGLEDGELYYYKVEADNSAGGSGDSPFTSETTELPAPSGLSANEV